MSDSQDLLPSSVLKARLLRSGMKFWAVVWIIVSLVATTMVLGKRSQLRSLEAASSHAAEKAAPIQKLEGERKQLETQIAKIRERESWLTESDSSQTLSLMGIISGAAETNQGRINVQSLRLASIERPVATPKQDNSKKLRANTGKKKKVEFEQRMELILNGYAVNDMAVASFISVLREASVFESVELRSSDSQVFNQHETRQYELTCIY